MKFEHELDLLLNLPGCPDNEEVNAVLSLSSEDLFATDLFNNLTNSLDNYHENLLQSLESLSSDRQLCLASAALKLFLRANWTGPPISPQSLPLWLSLGQVSESEEDTPLTRDVKNRLAYQGELCQEFIRVPAALYVASLLLNKFLDQAEYTTLPVWRSRWALCHQRSLQGGRRNPCPQLRRIGVTGLADWLKSAKLLDVDFRHHLAIYEQDEETDLPPPPPQPLSLEVQTLMTLEFGTALSTYGLSDAFEAHLIENDRLGFSAELTGRMGIRRRYQQDPVPQLVVDVRDQRRHSQVRIGETTEAVTVPNVVPITQLDPETDVLENPKLVDQDESSRPILAVEQQLYLLAWSNCILETSSPEDETSLLKVTSIVRECLRLPTTATTEDEFSRGGEHQLMLSASWLVYAYSLWMRSKAEYNRTKFRERSCLQMMHLEDQYKDPSPSAGHRLRYIFQLDFPNVWEMKLEVGNRFVKLGATLTAKEMFQQMKMWDECVNCLAVAGRKNEALDLVKEKLAENPESSALLCSLGDLSNDAAPYLKAWELSNGRYNRAARSLGRHYFEKQDIEAAAEWFKKAVTHQPLQPKTQFTLGACLMKLGKFQDALHSFGTVVALESENAEAWANLASIHIRLNQWDSAKKCIEQACKNARTNWRMWDTYCKVSIKNRDVYGCIQALRQLVALDKPHFVETWMLSFISDDVYRKAKELNEVKEATGKEATDGESALEGVRASFLSLLHQVLDLFKDYFAKYSLPLPSDGSMTEPILNSLDKYRIWSLVADLGKLRRDVWEIRNKQLRYLVRIIEDVTSQGLPKTLHTPTITTTAAMTDGALKLLCQTINELASALEGLNEVETDSHKFKEEVKVTKRFLVNVEQRVEKSIQSSNQIAGEDKASLIQNLSAMIKEANQKFSTKYSVA